jgi:hypothetical protein
MAICFLLSSAQGSRLEAIQEIMSGIGEFASEHGEFEALQEVEESARVFRDGSQACSLRFCLNSRV